MSANKFTDAFKRDAVAQVEDLGYLCARWPSVWGSVARQVNAKQSPKGSTKSVNTWQK